MSRPEMVSGQLHRSLQKCRKSYEAVVLISFSIGLCGGSNFVGDKCIIFALPVCLLMFLKFQMERHLQKFWMC